MQPGPCRATIAKHTAETVDATVDMAKEYSRLFYVVVRGTDK